MSIREVAARAGVSTATVSRVMNDSPKVRGETVAAVRAAIAELNYSPRRLPIQRVSAREGSTPNRRRRPAVASKPTGWPSLAAEVGLRTRTIGLITVGHSAIWFRRPVMGAALAGIQRGTAELGLRLLLEEMGDPTRPTELMLGGHIDGAIVLATGDLPAAAESQAFESIRSCVPCVRAMGTGTAPCVVDHVTVDNVAVGQLAAARLRSLGCRRLAFIADTPAWPLVRLRGQSFLNCGRDLGANDIRSYVVADDAKAAVGYGPYAAVEPDLARLIARLASDARRESDGGPLGLFVFNDDTTAKVHPLLARHGLRMGEDIHLVSCDAEQSRLDALGPRPESIDPGAAEIGFRAVVRLLSRIQRPDDPLLTIHVVPRL